MSSFVDQLGREVVVSSAKKIISTVPSQTELLNDLGLEEEVLSITKFCIHPSNWFQNKERIGGTKNLNISKIQKLKPDLIIANKEENVQEQIEELAKDFPVWISDVNTLEDALQMIDSIGKITDKEKKAQEIIETINQQFKNNDLSIEEDKPETVYLIWKDPYMTVGGDTFINDMMFKAGFQNLFNTHTRYPSVTIEELKRLNVDVLLLSSEPYPFKQKHIEVLQKELPSTKIVLVDGEMFSWYGSRLKKAPEYFQKLRQQLLSI